MNIHDNYILDDEGEPVVEPDLLGWARWFEQSSNRVVLQDRRGCVRISTVFLGLDHNFSLTGPPVLWETLIFEGALDGKMWRYTSRLDALIGHQHAVTLVETFRAVPRKTKKAMQKWAQYTRLHADERRRLRPVLLRLAS